MKLRKTVETQVSEIIDKKTAIKESSERFRKPFDIQFIKVYYLSIVGAVFFPLLSITLGTTFIASILLNIIENSIICFALGGILLVIWELAKYFVLNITFEIYFGNERGWQFVAIVLFLLQVGSICAGIFGVEKIYEMRNNQTEKINQIFKPQLDSLNIIFDRQISSNNAGIVELKKKAVGQWNGINTPEQYQLISTLQNSNTELLQVKNSKSIEIKRDKDLMLFQAAKSAGFNIRNFMIISLVIELLIFFCGAFLIFYDFKRAKKKEMLTSEMLEITEQDFLSYLDEYRLYNPPPKKQVQALPEAPKKIPGFVIGQNSNKTSNGAISTDAIGTSTFQKICAYCGVQFSTELMAKKFCCESHRVLYNEHKK